MLFLSDYCVYRLLNDWITQVTSFSGRNTDWAISWDMIQISVSCTTSFNISSDVHSFLFHAITSSHMFSVLAFLLICGGNSDLCRHIEECENCIYCSILYQDEQNLKSENMFHTVSNKAICNLLDGGRATMFTEACFCSFINRKQQRPKDQFLGIKDQYGFFKMRTD